MMISILWLKSWHWLRVPLTFVCWVHVSPWPCVSLRLIHISLWSLVYIFDHMICHRKRPCDMIRVTKKQLDSNFDVKCATIQFYNSIHNSQSDRLIVLAFYMESPDMLSYLGLKYQVNCSLERHHKTGQQKLYGFCYLLHFDLWTSYLARILFLKGYGGLF